MAQSTETSEALLGKAIASLHSPQFAENFCAWVQASVPYDNILIIVYYHNRTPERLFSNSILPKSIASLDSVYLAGAYLLDPFHDLHVEQAPRGVYRMSEIAPDRFRQNQYFLDYYRNTTMVDEIGFVTYPSNGVSVHACLGRDANSKQRFTNRQIATAKRIAPVVASLMESHWDNLNSAGTYIEIDITKKLMEAVKSEHSISLSPRQAEVAMLILRGHSSVSIGLQLGISFQTVKVFRKQLYKKCKISSQAELFTLLLPMLGN